jgi:hypothetical protein
MEDAQLAVVEPTCNVWLRRMPCNRLHKLAGGIKFIPADCLMFMCCTMLNAMVLLLLPE